MTSAPAPRPPLDTARLVAALDDHDGLRPEFLDETDSTNAVAADRAREGAPDGTLVVADHQRAGRGRLDRGWSVPPRAGLSFSLVLRPDLPPHGWPWLPLLTGLTVTRALVDLGYDARVKWPNDVLLPERKVAGILVERVATPTGPAAVLGIGLNVSIAEHELPVPTATSLLLARPDLESDRADLLAGIVRALRDRYDAWHGGDATATTSLAAEYAAACDTVGRAVRVSLPGGGDLTGRAVDVDASGMLVVETAGGVERVGAGDVVHVRPAPDTEVE
ncbi:biotin--[acetyl-CoA-carboxylase] ligase [Nocardioides panacisoli]|uniref:biotin--[acetyl-CoA-carboxylase] ligase n=1 Tax=Nocardioides panacisoli TaxID=627624 RepID=UPI001C62C19B|nr:biotin--[acetyl-CoA-carboxylase] ligase [Nocardioides panacisoli]QYJ04375.1 biotin--[acetyl-CoA-carboxylase] ligase [Nocardioides panacisoli]